MKSDDTEILLPFEFKVDKNTTDEPSWKNRKGITFQVDNDFHNRYMAAQAKTKGRLGKELKKLLERAINQVEPPKTA